MPVSDRHEQTMLRVTDSDVEEGVLTWIRAARIELDWTQRQYSHAFRFTDSFSHRSCSYIRVVGKKPIMDSLAYLIGISLDS